MTTAKIYAANAGLAVADRTCPTSTGTRAWNLRFARAERRDVASEEAGAHHRGGAIDDLYLPRPGLLRQQ